MFATVETHCLWKVGTQYLVDFLNICSSIEKKWIRVNFGWIKFIFLCFEEIHDVLCIFFLAQSQINITARGLSPHMTNILIRGIFLIVSPSLSQQSPNRATLVNIIVLFVSYTDWKLMSSSSLYTICKTFLKQNKN